MVNFKIDKLSATASRFALLVVGQWDPHGGLLVEVQLFVVLIELRQS